MWITKIIQKSLGHGDDDANHQRVSPKMFDPILQNYHFAAHTSVRDVAMICARFRRLRYVELVLSPNRGSNHNSNHDIQVMSKLAMLAALPALRAVRLIELRSLNQTPKRDALGAPRLPRIVSVRSLSVQLCTARDAQNQLNPVDNFVPDSVHHNRDPLGEDQDQDQEEEEDDEDDEDRRRSISHTLSFIFPNVRNIQFC